MKKLVLFVTAVILVSCNNKYKVEGTTKDVKNGTKAILLTSNEMGGPQPLDTSIVTDGKFSFEGKAELPEIAFVTFETENGGSLPFILENGTITLDYDNKNIQNSKISGTDNNDLYAKYNLENKDIFAKAKKINDENIAILSKKPETEEEKAKVKVVMEQFRALQEEMNVKSKNFIKANPNTFVSVLLTENLFFKGLLTDKETDKIISQLDDNLKKTKSALSIIKMLNLNKQTEKNQKQDSKKALEFSAKSPEGKEISLKESMGKVTIIDFWASWCGPCRKENPNVVALYNELHSKGLNIIGVSLDEDASKWKEAIAKDKLTWTHVSNLKGWKDPIAQMYNVDQIPSTFILDEKGTIVAKDLRGEELKAKVKALLGVK
ncbi:Thiol:disulfide interchange lipoprotein precursor [Flavobacterium indicum GPTSA100-9 = DSM 17447]|uniref:Thiol:disulfide interchange lipoprotein n=1 Tax=Flavobacterium indicum (strain DSM 17447 / CIP 109464 / GPTSA100-9) TaxID=1094466 RepID=H8XU05_FLAIG|nr:TlpA disulfide reductase family protein [Flavobacterium indicum]CCG53735.1 Thiol:disulfide interchange lipoprotein precursor [Flavobacterium indicum GPTSA100-9 = DSM 17447]